VKLKEILEALEKVKPKSMVKPLCFYVGRDLLEGTNLKTGDFFCGYKIVTNNLIKPTEAFLQYSVYWEDYETKDLNKFIQTNERNKANKANG
jgi:hypothetical protein